MEKRIKEKKIKEHCLFRNENGKIVAFIDDFPVIFGKIYEVYTVDGVHRFSSPRYSEAFNEACKFLSKKWFSFVGTIGGEKHTIGKGCKTIEQIEKKVKKGDFPESYDSMEIIFFPENKVIKKIY
jgi:hypothetical protein